MPSDEDLTPTIENTIVFLWLQLIHPGLPQFVKQRYGAELRNNSLASIKPEISQALESLLDELRSIEDSKVLRTFSPRYTSKKRSFKSCILCKTAGCTGSSSHGLVDCKYLPEFDKRARSRMVCDNIDEQDSYTGDEGHGHDTMPQDLTLNDPFIDNPSALRVNIIQSPYLNVYYNQYPLKLTIDTGATTNMIKSSVARHMGLHIKPVSQMARQADGVTPLDVKGEIHCTVTRSKMTFQLDALVVDQLDVDVLAGNPFMVMNDVATRPAKKQIVLRGSDIVYYGPQSHSGPSARRTQSYLLCHSHPSTVILPGEFLEAYTPSDAEPDTVWALEPRTDQQLSSKLGKMWPQPQVIHSVGGALRITNTTDQPILIQKHQQFGQILATSTADQQVPYSHTCSPNKATSPIKPFSKSVSIDQSNSLPSDIRQRLAAINLKYDEVFNPRIAKYNGASGDIQAVVNMGPVLPPQRKGRLPQYNTNKMHDLQSKFDELEEAGVFAKPDRSILLLNI